MKPSAYLTQVFVTQNGRRLFIGRYDPTEAEAILRRAERAVAKGLRLDLLSAEARRTELEALRSQAHVLGPILLELGNRVMPDFNWDAAAVHDKFQLSLRDAPAGPRRIQQAVHYLATTHGKRIRSTLSASTLFCKFILPGSDRTDNRVIQAFRNRRAASPVECPPRPKRIKKPARALQVPPERRRRMNSATARLIDLNTFTTGITRVIPNASVAVRAKVIAFLNYHGIDADTHLLGDRLFITRN